MTKIVNLPRGLKVDIFSLPEDFDDRIKQAFADCTYGTNANYTYQDKLAFVDRVRQYLHHASDTTECVKNLVLKTYEYNLSEYGELTDIDDFATLEFAETVFDEGRTNLYAHYTGDHHIDDKIMEMLVRIVKVVIDY